jgi:hypothetical protein
VPQVYINGINVALGKSTYQTSNPVGAGYGSTVGVDGSLSTFIYTAASVGEWLPYLHAAGGGGGGVCRRSGSAVQWSAVQCSGDGGSGNGDGGGGSEQ